ncbi:MAG: DUF2007 domain-containing protein [Paramuribaculum sp.]|nr:DUF2007 domain-containing protein [Paramuribaculum sp.]
MYKGNSKNGLIRIYVFENDIDAHIAHDVLADNGVESTMSNQLMSTILPLDFSSMGGVSLWVFECDATRAVHILREHGWNCAMVD